MPISIDINMTRRDLELIVIALNSLCRADPSDEVLVLRRRMHAICQNDPTLNLGKDPER
jgi:hypothetical protein